MISSTHFRIATAFAALTLVACAPRIAITTYQPAKYNLGRANQLTIVQSEGQRSAREFIISQIATQARASGRFLVKDRTEEGITVKITGRTVQVSGGSGAAQTAEEVGLRIDVYEYGANMSAVQKTDSKGRPYTVNTFMGKVVLGATVFNAQGRAILAETEYKGAFESPDSEEVAKNTAAQMAVAALLADITPVPVKRAVELDDKEETYKPIIETAKAGNLPKAIEDTKAFIGTNPNSAGAHYNLGVYLDAQGAYEEALAAYDKAISLSNKELYVKSRAECAKRMNDAKMLSE